MAVSMMEQMERFLGVTSRRQTVLASNMANVDTPGYRTEDVDFGKEMQRAMAAPAGSAAATAVQVHAVPGLLERPDGNNVDMDREGMLLAETQLSYQMGTQLLKQRFHQLLSAINSGGGS